MVMGMTTVGEVYRMCRRMKVYRRCTESVQKVCTEGVQKVYRRCTEGFFLVNMQLFTPSPFEKASWDLGQVFVFCSFRPSERVPFRNTENLSKTHPLDLIGMPGMPYTCYCLYCTNDLPSRGSARWTERRPSTACSHIPVGAH